MRLTVLGSSSAGNATLVQSGETAVLIDCGFSAKEMNRRLMAVGQDPTRLSGIVITHEHSDHIKGVSVLARATGVPVYISPIVREVVDFGANGHEIKFAEPLASSQPFEIGAITFYPFSVPHDAVDPFAFTFQAEGIKAAIVTDLGYYTQLVAEYLRGCHCIIIESNHDLEMLKIGPYPWSLKQRVMSRQGHVSNDELARFLREDFDGTAEHLILAHLSRTTNHPDIARLTALQALEARGPLFFRDAEQRLKLARHDRPMEWLEL